MSLFGAMNTAVSGLTAQSDAFGNISENIANSQTVGYKGVNTNFVDYLTTSTATQNQPGSVVAVPSYTNSVQGTITQSSDPLALAIDGQGYFAVAQPEGNVNAGQTTFNPLQDDTRARDFTTNSQGYLVNSAGEYLQGWLVNPATGVINQSQLQPIQVSQAQFNPVLTSTMNFAANLPATPAAGTPMSSDVQVYDSIGTQHTLALSWTQLANNSWQVSISSPDNTPSTTIGTAVVQFGPTTSGNPVSAGTIGAFGATTGAVTGAAYAAGGQANLTITPNFGNGAQPITLDLGGFGQANGVTQFAGTTYAMSNFSQNGVAAGSFTSLSTETNGNIVANYNNGQSQVIAQVPITTFAAPDALQQQNGQSFTATASSGNPITQSVNTNGAGGLVTGSVESSNVDIATEFSKLIIAQQTYSANAKVLTTADQLVQTTINILQ